MNDHRSKFSNLSNWKEEEEKKKLERRSLKKKNQAFNGIRTRAVTSELPVRCSTN